MPYIGAVVLYLVLHRRAGGPRGQEEEAEVEDEEDTVVVEEEDVADLSDDCTRLSIAEEAPILRPTVKEIQVYN